MRAREPRSILSALAVVPLVLASAKAIGPTWSLADIRLRVLIVMGWLQRLPKLSQYADACRNPHLSRELGRHAAAFGAVHWPYMHAGWSPDERLEAIADHYRELDHGAGRIDLAPSDEMLVADLGHAVGGLSIVLDRAPWFEREGQLVMNLFLHGRRIYSLAFSLGRERGERIVRVGALQGMQDPSALDLYRAMTRQLHGLRPRDLVIDALKMLAQIVGATHIHAVANKNRHHFSSYFETAKAAEIHVDYDEFWHDHGGELQPSGFYAFSSKLHIRSPEKIISKKRSMYRRRHEFLKLVEASMGRNLRGN